jgi:hypothetical protein
VKRTGADTKTFGREEAMEQQQEAAEARGMDANSLRDLNAVIRALTSGAGAPNIKWYDADDIPVL